MKIRKIKKKINQKKTKTTTESWMWVALEVSRRLNRHKSGGKIVTNGIKKNDRVGVMIGE